MNQVKNYSILSQYYDMLTNIERRNELGVTIQRIMNSNKEANNRILDIACGTGNLSEILAKNHFHVIGIDNSDEMIAIAKEKNRKNHMVEIIHMDMNKLNIDTKISLAVCTSFSMSYLCKIAEKKKCISSIYHLLINGGVFILDMLHPKYVFDYFSNQTIKNILGSTIETKLVSYDISSGEYAVEYLIRNGENIYTELHNGCVIEPKKLISIVKSAGFHKVDYKERDNCSSSNAYELFCYK